MVRSQNNYLLGVLAHLFLFLAGTAVAQNDSLHIDTAAGVRFKSPFPVYQKKTPLQIENLIKESIPGEWKKNVLYSSAIYSDNSDAFIVVWRQAISELPTRYQFTRLKFYTPLRSAAKVSDVEIFEDRAAATYTVNLPNDVKARVALFLTKTDNVFIGLYSKNAEDLLGFVPLFSSVELDPKRRVAWTELSSGLKPVWSGFILAIGFFTGFILYLITVLTMGRRNHWNLDAKKSGDFSSPDQQLHSSTRIPKGF